MQPSREDHDAGLRSSLENLGALVERACGAVFIPHFAGEDEDEL